MSTFIDRQFPRRTLAAAALMLSCLGAQATSLFFTGVTDSGPLVGASFSGAFSFNELTAPTDGDAPLTSFSMSFAGQTYTLASATAAPSAVFSGGSFVGLSYIDGSAPDPGVRAHVGLIPGFFALDGAYLAYEGAGGAAGFGSYGVSAVPEPATAALWLAGLCVLGAAVRGRRG